MPLVNQISALATRMGTECKAIRASMGALTSLNTTEKATLVGAINEVLVAAGSGGTVTVASITDASAIGRNVLKAVDGPAIRGLIGAGTSSLTVGTSASHAKAGNWVPAIADVTGTGTTGRALMAAADAAAGRTVLGTLSAAEVDTRISTIVGAAPAALDTLTELAAALGGDANFAATTTTALSNRLRVDAAQSLTSAQQLQGRSNIGAVAAAAVGDTETDFVAVFNAAL